MTTTGLTQHWMMELDSHSSHFISTDSDHRVPTWHGWACRTNFPWTCSLFQCTLWLPWLTFVIDSSMDADDQSWLNRKTRWVSLWYCSQRLHQTSHKESIQIEITRWLVRTSKSRNPVVNEILAAWICSGGGLISLFIFNCASLRCLVCMK